MNYEWDVARARRGRLLRGSFACLASLAVAAVPLWALVHFGLPG